MTERVHERSLGVCELFVEWSGASEQLLALLTISIATSAQFLSQLFYLLHIFQPANPQPQPDFL